MKRLIIKITTIVLLIGILFSCSNSKKNLDNISLRLQWFHLAQFSGFYCAEDQGFYKENNIDITINPGGPDFNAITLVANGSETFGVWTADQILLAQSNGVPIKIVAVIFRDDPNVYMVDSTSNIFSPHDFKGKTITTVYGRSTETVLNALLFKENISINEVEIEPFPFNLQTFINGDVDVSAAYVYDHPFQARKFGMDIRIINPKDYGIKFYSDCIFVRNDLIEKNPCLIERFIASSLQGWNFALNYKDSAVESTLKRSPQLDRESQLYMINDAESLIKAEKPNKLGFISDTSLIKMVEILQRQGQLPLDFDYKKSYTNVFVNEYYNQYHDK